MDWKDYQEETAEFFRSLGLDAKTDVTLKGVRTNHDIDVLVKSHHVGFDVTWIIECKHWKTKVTKLHVLALREIVSDTGADRGILLAENGFQSGAIEAANLTNVHVTSLANVFDTASNEFLSMKLRDIFDRTTWCKEEYWELSKDKRIECGLRAEPHVIGYSGDWVVKVAEDLIGKAFRGVYPIFPDEMHRPLEKNIIAQDLPQQINSLSEMVNYLESILIILENKINACKAGIKHEA